MPHSLSVWLFLFFFNSVSNGNSIRSNEQKTFSIVIDPGHGGSDRGAVRDSFVESEIVYAIALKLKKELLKTSNSDNIIVTLITRNKDSGSSLKDRVLLANQNHANLFVSLHANTSNSSTVAGQEFYFNSQKINFNSNRVENNERFSSEDLINRIKNDFSIYDKTEKSLLLSKILLTKSAEKSEKGIIKRAPFYVIEHTEMPSILIELGFISNRREAKKLINEENQDEIARRIANSILEFKEKSDKNPSL